MSFFSPLFNFPIGGSSLADLIHVYRLHLSDLSNPVPGPSQGGDSIVPFLYRLLASLGASPLAASGAGAVRHWVCFGFFSFSLGPSSFLTCFPSGSSLPLASPVAPLPSSFPSVSAPAGFPSSFASSLPHFSSLASTFPFSSPSAASLLPSPAPLSFPIVPPVHQLAPPVGLCYPAPSLAPSVAPYSFSVSSLLPSGPSALSPFLPSCAPAPVGPFPCATVTSSSFPFVFASSVDTAIS